MTGITEAAVHLPLHRLPDKQLDRAHRRQGYQALRLPWWDEDPLTLAVEAALKLPPAALEPVERIHLALDEATDQPGLVPTALGLQATVVEHTGPDAGLAALAAADPDRPALIAAGGEATGGAGVALVLGDEGIPVRASHRRGATGLQDAPLEPLDELVGSHGVEHLVLPAGRLGRRARLPVEPRTELTPTVGDAGAAAALLELCHDLTVSAGARHVASPSRGQALLVELGPGQVPVHGLEDPWTEDTTVEAWRQLTDTETVPWAQASQGAYVSMETYEADPERRYGVRATGPGTVEAVTTIHAGPPGEFLAQHEAAGPYDVAIVRLDAPDGRRVIGQSAVPPGQLTIDDRVRPALRRLFQQEGRWRYALKWWPDER